MNLIFPAGLHGSNRRPNGNRERRHEYLRTKVVRELVRYKGRVLGADDEILSSSQDEIHPDLRFTGAGILAMANSGPNTNGQMPLLMQELHEDTETLSETSGSQFFLTLAPTPYLDTKHTIFGRVSSGMRVLQRLGAVATDAQDKYALSSLPAPRNANIDLGPEKMSRSIKLE